MGNDDIRKAGLKVTEPRVKILTILESSKPAHISAEEIFKQLTEQGEDIGLATVYRVLTQFEEAELVIRHQFAEGHSVFELDDGKHHDHLICTHCGKIEDFVDPVIEERQKVLAKERGFELMDHKLTLYGVCRECSRTQ